MKRKGSFLLTACGWGLILAVAIAFFLLGEDNGEDEDHRVVLRECTERLRVLGNALQIYTGKNGGSFPVELEELFQKGFLSDSQAFSCPSKHFHYVYTGMNLNRKTVSSGMPVAFDRVNNHPDCINVLFADFQVQTIPLEESCYSSLISRFQSLSPEERKQLSEKFRLLDKIFFLK